MSGGRRNGRNSHVGVVVVVVVMWSQKGGGRKV